MSSSVENWTLGQVARHRQFQFYWIATVADSIAAGLWMAMLLWVAATASPPVVGTAIIAIGVIPALLLAPLGGLLSDRLGQGRTVVVTTGLRTAILAVWLLFGTAQDPNLLLLALVAMAFTGVTGLHEPAVTTYMSSFLPPAAAPAGRSAEATGQRIALMVGTGAGGGALALSGGRFLATLGAVTTAALATVLFIRVYRQAPDRVSQDARGRVAQEPFLRRFGRGLEVLNGLPIVRRVIAAQLIAGAFVEGALVAGLPFLVRYKELPEAAFTWSLSGFFAGLLAGSVLIGVLLPRIHRMPKVGISCFLAAGFALAPVGLVSPETWWSMPALTVISGVLVAAGGTSLTGWTMQQVQREAEQRGQAVMGRFGAVIAIAKQSDYVGILLVGVSATAVGIDTTIVASGLLLVAVMAALLVPRMVREA